MDKSYPGYVKAPKSLVLRVGIFLVDLSIMYSWTASIGDRVRVSLNLQRRVDDTYKGLVIVFCSFLVLCL
jgi:hypothetical protein